MRSKGRIHTRNSNQSEADDEEDETESTLDEADGEPSGEHTHLTVAILWLHT